MIGEPFSPWRFRAAQIEFDYFRRHARGYIDRALEGNARFIQLRDSFSFYVVDSDADRLQIFFGQRSMFRKSADGKLAIESGLTLLYTLGGDGSVAVILYPVASGIAKPIEDHLFLAIQRLTGHQLLARLKQDLAQLIAYGHVTSIDAAPTLGERLNIWWLRFAQPKQIEGKFTPAELPGLASKLGGAFGTSLLAALMRPLVLIGVIAALLYLGRDELADWLQQ